MFWLGIDSPRPPPSKMSLKEALAIDCRSCIQLLSKAAGKLKKAYASRSYQDSEVSSGRKAGMNDWLWNSSFNIHSMGGKKAIAALPVFFPMIQTAGLTEQAQRDEGINPQFPKAYSHGDGLCRSLHPDSLGKFFWTSWTSRLHNPWTLSDLTWFIITVWLSILLAIRFGYGEWLLRPLARHFPRQHYPCYPCHSGLPSDPHDYSCWDYMKKFLIKLSYELFSSWQLVLSSCF